MWSNNALFSSPDPWVIVSGTSATEGAVGREESPQEDPLAWDLPRTPMRSPLDIEEGLSEAFSCIPRPSAWLPTKPPLQDHRPIPSSSGLRRSPKKPKSGSSRYCEEIYSSGRDSSDSSSRERRRRQRRKRDRSVRRNSPSRSPTRSRGTRSPRFPPSKSRRPVSPQGTWVFVPSKSTEDLARPTRATPEQEGDSPPRRVSTCLARESPDELRTASCRPKSRPRDNQSGQRRESSSRMGSLDRPPHREDARGRAPSSSRSKSRPRDTQSAQRRESSSRMGSLDRSPHREATRGRASPSRALMEEPISHKKPSRRREVPIDDERRGRGSHRHEGARGHASPHRSEGREGETSAGRTPLTGES
ncbi:serine/arginine-rich splicing factor 4-like [Palaemon carinicauda]|uniref:serine/arginine-rich splicing factor 4-like n=1 Tax=Palaemon carinicauda TaxID=392227 RepID=UPI0035B63E06